MFAAYSKEREGVETEIEPEKGFATWKMIPPVSREQFQQLAQQGIEPAAPAAWLIDIFVAPDYRKNGVASTLADRVAAAAKAQGATKLLGSVDARNHTRTAAMKAILAGGFEFTHVDGQMLWFARPIS